MEENLKPLQDKKKYRHRPEPLFIPPPSFNFSMSHSGAMLYQSQLRSPRVLGDHLLDRPHELPPYTPPPMLSPVRQGSGLFSSVITSSHSTSHAQLPLTPLTPTPRVLLCRSSKCYIYRGAACSRHRRALSWWYHAEDFTCEHACGWLCYVTGQVHLPQCFCIGFGRGGVKSMK